MSFYSYKIIETSNGPQIRHSTKSIYDVMVSQEAGDDLFAICLIHGLSSAQVHLAQDYIEEHEPNLQMGSMVRQQKKLERLNALRAIAHERARVELESSPQHHRYEGMLRVHEQLRHSSLRTACKESTAARWGLCHRSFLVMKIVWLFCQKSQYLLLTGNRTKKGGAESLDHTIQYLVTDTSLPVITIGDMERLRRDRLYCERCAERLAEIVMDLNEKYLGGPRLYLS